jgi:ABC-type glycerol-3-phosphate transport system substrate-binding protein
MTGRVAMNVEGGWIWSTFSAIKDFRWGMAPVPGMKSNKNSENLNIWCMGSAPNREGAWEVVKFITSQDGQRAWVQITGAQPSRPDVLDEWVKKHAEHGMKPEDIRAFVNENVKNTVESMDHMIVDYSRFDDAYNQKVAELWNGKVDVNSFLANLKATWDTTAKEIYAQYKDKLLKS